MSERFTIYPQSIDLHKSTEPVLFKPIKDNDKPISIPEACKLLNDYDKENQQLRKDIDYYKTERAALFEYLDKKDNLKLELRCDKK